MRDAWDPALYHRFQTERSQPFFDLAALVERHDGAVAADLGCGSGELTARLPALTGATDVLGVDRSAAMLDAAAGHTSAAVRFERGDIAAFERPGGFDIVFSNAAVQWVPDHRQVLRRWVGSLRPGGQIAVQLPANADHPSHALAATVGDELAVERPDVFPGGQAPPDASGTNGLRPEQYAQILHELGAQEQHVRLQVYGHLLPSTGAVVDWMRGTTLTRFRSVLDDTTYAEFERSYAERVVATLGDHTPFFYPFKRILFWARF